MQGIKIVWNGDSISYGAQLNDKSLAFPFLVGKALDAKVLNYAIGGATAARQEGEYERVFLSLPEWEKFIDKGEADKNSRYLVKDNFFAVRPYRIYRFENTSWVPGGKESTDSGRTPLEDRVEEMELDADIVGIMIGTNDFYYDWTPFGSVEEGYVRVSPDLPRNVTFCGAMHRICRRLLLRYPNSLITLLTPIKRYQPIGIGRGTWNCFYPEDRNHLGLTLDDYRRAILAIADYYSIPTIDLYAKSGLNPGLDASLFADKDGKHVHPNEEGHRRIAKLVTGALRALGV